MNDRPKPEQAPAFGLCARCIHARIIQSDRGSQFLRCGLSDTDPAFPRFPALPVRTCTGFAERDKII